MSIAALASPPIASSNVQRTPYRFSVDEYYRMGALGCFAGKPRVELLDGLILQIMPTTPAHDGTVHVADEILKALALADWRVRIKSSLRLTTSSPLPDVCVALGDRRTYLTRHPAPADVGLVVEVADSSLAEDRQVKCRLYAQDGGVAVGSIAADEFFPRAA